ncbi:MAG: 23S rRNA (pseudouridine(1915)-N(3))-methyltransferase RlmH [Candidatus Poseidoniaceae archaeon]|jgi:23S rRNA (pseudouridine1915-N3)-methyltransferase|nr:23S rRNA (pseudouridine(1915)-N(3))-methyltransferase RlmH [Candidatus Poseidoniaceae archaeon]
MGRIIVHLHGKPSQRNCASLIEEYSERLKSKVKIEYHNSKLTTDEYVSLLPQDTILCDEGGPSFSSVMFAKQFAEWTLSTSDVHIAIGPTDGFPKEISNQKISLSQMTLPHELAAVILIEQLYRSCEINKGSSYHRI